MKTNEVEKLLGLTKHTILYYEKEGFIKPERTNNGYRNYNEIDIQILRLVKFLREMDISIDDIKAILDNKISFNDCLKIRKSSLDNSIKELQEIKEEVDHLNNMQVPLIPALAKIKSAKLRKGLGYRKTTETIAYNRPLTRSMAFHQILSASIISFIFTWITYLFFWNENHLHPFNFIMNMFIFICFILFFIFIDFHWTMNIYDKSQNQSIEFLENGIKIYKRKGYSDHFIYKISALINKHHKYQNFYYYEEIDKLVIDTKRRYSPLYALGLNSGIAMACEMYEVDLTFYFSNGEKYFLLGPSTYDNDSQFIGYILEAKIPNIVDSENIIYAYQNKINLTDFMHSKI